MKNKIKNIKNKIKNEGGLVIVESAIVFPVMFFILFFILFIGNMYYEQSKVDAIVLRNAIRGAECVASPFLYDYQESGKIPTTVKGLDIEPYRYIFGGFSAGNINDLENKISQKVRDEINNRDLIFFSNSRANIVGYDGEKIAYFRNFVLYSTFVVQVNYQIKFPIRFMGEESPTVYTFSARAEVPVSDTAEFIRNIDMVVDLVERTSAGESIKGFFEKINGFIEQFTEK